jgi:hypothetical protein
MKSVSKTKRSTNGKHAVARRPNRKGAVTLIPALKASTLKDVLWETLVDLRGNMMPANRADAIAAQAREILRTVKTQLQVTNAAKRPVPQQIVDFSEQ